MEKLKQILKKENKDNYADYGTTSNAIISHKERLLQRIEYAVFGNSDIQKAEFKLFSSIHTQFKNGMTCYDTNFIVKPNTNK